MEINNYNILNYFNYDIEKVLDEFNNYYNTNHRKIPLYYQTIYLYFSNLSEISLQLLIKTKYNIKNAKDITKLIPIHSKYLSKNELLNNMRQFNITPLQYYGLLSFSYFFYEIFLEFVKSSRDRELLKLASKIPVIEYNLNLTMNIIKSPQYFMRTS